MLEPSDDAAHVILGGDWQIPTIEQVNELTANTTLSFDQNKGTYVFTATNGNRLFLPKSGYYTNTDINGADNFYIWTKNMTSTFSGQATYLWNINNNTAQTGNFMRNVGMVIRGIIA